MDILKSFENLHLLVRGIEPDKFEVSKIFKNCILKSNSSEDFYKSWSIDLQKQFPNGVWRTVSGAKVFINNGRVVAGLEGFNGEIDKFFKEREAKKVEIGDRLFIDKSVNKAWKEEITKWANILPEKSLPTLILGNQSAFNKSTGQKVNFKGKYAVSLNRGDISMPKDLVPKHILDDLIKTGWLTEQLLEVKDYVHIPSKYFKTSMQVLAINSSEFKSPSDLSKKKLETNQKYKEKTGNNFHLNLSGEGTLVHEFGHIFYNRARISTNDWGQIHSKWMKEFDPESKTYLNRPKNTILGGFASIEDVNRSEAFAEAFSNYFTNEGKDLPNYVYDFIKTKVESK